MWYTGLPWASIPHYYSVPSGKPGHAWRPSPIDVCHSILWYWPYVLQQPTSGDGSAASLLEVGVWAIIAKVRVITSFRPNVQCALLQFCTFLVYIMLMLSGEGRSVLLGDGHSHRRAAAVFHGKSCKTLRWELLLLHCFPFFFLCSMCNATKGKFWFSVITSLQGKNVREVCKVSVLQYNILHDHWPDTFRFQHKSL